MNAQEIRELFKGYDVSLGAKDVWEVQGTPVIKHSALERLAAALKIRFDPPTVLRAERDEAVILTVGRLGDVSEWSIGEALVSVNYRVSGKMAAYVYAMAEKRSKDRVILKLANLHGAYSEEEADEFKQVRSPATEEQTPKERQPTNDRAADQVSAAEELVAAIKARPSLAAIDKLWARADFKALFNELNAEHQAWVRSVDTSRRAEFEAAAPLMAG